MDSLNPFGRTWLWHPTGAKVEVPLPSDPQAMFKAVNDYLAAGFTVEAPENALKVEKLEVAFVVRAQFMNKKNEVKTRLYFYREYGEMGSDMTVYIDNEGDATKFEQFSGLRIADMPLFEGDVAPQRTGLQFAKYAVPCEFTVTRDKEAPSQKYANGRWRLVDYVSSKVAQNAPKTPLISSDGGNGNHTSQHAEIDATDYEAQALNWFASNGVSIVEVMRRLNVKKGALPKSTDKDGWRKVIADYKALVEAAAS